MFYCEVTKRLSKPGEKCNKIVTQRALRVYTKMVRDEETRRMIKVEVGKGWEIVKEIDATDEGALIWYAQNPLGPVTVERVEPKRKAL